MVSKQDQNKQKHEKIIAELQSRLSLSATYAAFLYDNGTFDSLTVQESLLRLRQLSDTFGNVGGGLVLSTRPKCVMLPLERLEARVDDLRQWGHTGPHARLILSLCIDIVGLNDAEFREKHSLLRKFFSDPAEACSFLVRYPVVFLMPLDHLRGKSSLQWAGDHEAFLRSLDEGLASGQANGRSPGESAAEPGPSAELLGAATKKVAKKIRVTANGRARNWKRLAFEIMRRRHRGWSRERMALFVSTHEWIWDLNGPGPEALEEISRWLSSSTPGSIRRKHARFLERLFTDEDMQTLLRQPPSILNYRMVVIRRYLERNFIDQPKLLLMPWESVAPDELRFRIHEVMARGKNPGRKPYLNMLLAPTRERFVSRLARWLSRF